MKIKLFHIRTVVHHESIARVCFALALGAWSITRVTAQEPSSSKTESAAPATEDVKSTETKKKQILNFENADLRVVIQALAKQVGYSLILPEDVKGVITARLVDVPVEKAMRIILESKGYSLIEVDGIYQVKSKDSISSEPTKTEVFQFANATAKEAQNTVQSLITKGGKVQLDERSNSLIITDVPSNLAKIMPIIKTLDSATPQVMIETKMLEVQNNPQRNIGVQWPTSFASTFTPNQGLITENGTGFGFQTQRFPGTGTLAAGGPAAPGIAVQQQLQATGPLAALMGPIPAIAVMSMPTLSATLNVLMTDVDTELLASPKVITADNQKANIKIVRQQPIPNYTFNQQTASFTISGFEYKDIGNLLEVTPHVNKDNYVTMDVLPTVSSSNQNQTFNLGTGGAGTVDIPIINIRTLTSRVMVKSGNTLALGGLLQNEMSQTYRKVPFLGDIPGLGELFTNRNYTKTKRNLLIFITPTIVRGDGNTGLEDQYDRLRDTDEDARFAYKKDFIGNARPLNQMHDLPDNGGSLPDVGFPDYSGGTSRKKEKQKISAEALSDRTAKSDALKQASEEKEQGPEDLHQDQLSPRLLPSLRE